MLKAHKKPKAYANTPDEILILKQLKSYHKKGKVFELNVDNLKNSWQLYFITDYQYNTIKTHPYFYFKTPVVIKFNHTNFFITQGCQSLKGDYYWSAMEEGNLITDNIQYSDTPCNTNKTAINRIYKCLAYPQFFPIKINNKIEPLLIIEGEDAYGGAGFGI